MTHSERTHAASLLGLKGGSPRAEREGMPPLPALVWLLVAGAGAACALTMLAAAAAWLRRECMIHDLRVEALRLRAEYERTLKQINAGEEPQDDEQPFMIV